MKNPKFDLRALKQALAEAGAFDRHEARSWAKAGLLFGAFVALVVAIAVLPWWVGVGLVPLAVVPAVSAAMIGHEGGHRSFSGSRFRNELLLHLAFPVFGGLSALYWKHKHNGQHHVYTNVVGRDPDLELWPMASSRADHERAGRGLRWFQRRAQGVAFWPLTLMLVWSMRVASVRHLVWYARNRGIDRAWLTDAAALVAHGLLWVVLPALLFGPVALLFYVALWSLSGVALSAIFGPAHMGLPVHADSDDPWMLQLQGTRNLRMPRVMAWFFIGLDHQVEHHLFPRIPHHNMRRAAAVVRAWAAELGLPYQEIGFFRGLADVTRHMRVAWNLEPAEVTA